MAATLTVTAIFIYSLFPAPTQTTPAYLLRRHQWHLGPSCVRESHHKPCERNSPFALYLLRLYQVV